MNENLIFRSLESDDANALLELFQTSFGRRLPLEWWHWFDTRCPTGPNRTTVIEDKDRGILVGSYSLLPIRLRFNNKVINASLATNANTHPDYQGRGLFTRIGEYTLAQERNFDRSISLGMPNQKALPGHKKVGWNVLFDLPFLVKKNCRKASHRCREISAFDNRFDEFFHRIAQRFSFIVLKDYRFMNWRVVERPDKEYTRFIYEEGLTIRGYVVLKHFDAGGYSKTHILDIQADTDDVLSELIGAAENFAEGRDELNLWTNIEDPYQQKFLQHGFSLVGSTDLLISHFNYGEKEALEEGAWWFCLADNDVY